MKHWVPTQKILIISGSVLVVALATYFVAIYLVSSKIGEIESVYLEAESSVGREEMSRQIGGIANNHKEEIQTLRNFFITEGDEVGFIEEIESVARKSGVIFEIASISQKSSNENVTKEDINLRVDMEGSWRNIMDFVNNLESMPFGLSITSMNVEIDNSRQWAGFVEFVVFREK